MKDETEADEDRNATTQLDYDNLPIEPDEELARRLEERRVRHGRRYVDLAGLSDEEKKMYDHSQRHIDSALDIIRKMDEARKRDDQTPDVLTQRERNTILEAIDDLYDALTIQGAFFEMKKFE